ncbi:MAG: hypothetical protein J2P25_26350, partial [Nocardiopsaceae bacterium]|nr:hypothetical protein [Nocardiopsaceae bacterium]
AQYPPDGTARGRTTARKWRMHRKRSLKAATGAVLLAGAAVTAAAGGGASAQAAAAVTGDFTGTLANGTTWVADVPANWNGTLLLYSHGFGPLTAADAPDPTTRAALLARGYALAGSSYDPNGSEWALDTAVSDQFGTLKAVEDTVLPSRPRQVLAVGSSMGGLVSALEDQDSDGRVNGVLTTCGIVAGGINLNEFQLDGEYAIAQLLLPGQQVQLTGFGGPEGASEAASTAATLTAAAARAQQTPAGRARLALALAFLNAIPWDPGATTPAPASDPAAQEAAQYDVQFSGSSSIMDFIELGRASIDQADGGSANWNAGIDYARVLAKSPYRHEVAALYQAAGLSLGADLDTLTRNATITADPGAVASLERTSVPTGHLQVPELDLHTIGDNLVPVEMENFYAKKVAVVGDSGLLRQAFTESFGHCNFSSAELVAGVLALQHRVTTGHWDQAADPASLNQVATSLGLGPARFAENYYPGPLTGATGLRESAPWPTRAG